MRDKPNFHMVHDHRLTAAVAYVLAQLPERHVAPLHCDLTAADWDRLIERAPDVGPGSRG